MTNSWQDASNDGIINTGSGNVSASGSVMGRGNRVGDTGSGEEAEVDRLIAEVRELIKANSERLDASAVLEQDLDRAVAEAAKPERDGRYVTFLLDGISRALQAAGAAITPVASLATAIANLMGRP